MQPNKPVWDKKRPKDLGDSKPLSSKAKSTAKAEAKSAAYWADKVKWADGGSVELQDLHNKYAEGGSPIPTEPSFLGALKDPQFRSEVGNNFMTAVNRGAVGMTLGAPVDLTNMAINLGVAGYGYLGNKLGLLTPEQMPELNNEPFGGSEWIGNKMQEAGIINSNRNLPAEIIAGTVLPFGFNALEARIPQMVRGLDQLAANYNALDDLNTGQYMGQRGAVKSKGGNWLSRSVEESLNPLKHRGTPSIAFSQEEADDLIARGFVKDKSEEGHYLPPDPLNNWVDNILAKYVKNDMATQGDPLRAMAEKYAVDKPAKLAEVQGRIDAFAAKMEQTARERGVPVGDLTSMRQQMIGLEKEKALVEARQALHFEPQGLGPQVRQGLRHTRMMEGFPGAGLGQSELAQRWETATDAPIVLNRAGDLIDPRLFTSDISGMLLASNPWLSKVPPETPVYGTSSMLTEHTGFNHLVDELRNATNPESGLPKNLLIDPADLGKITMPQAVDRVADINAWRMVQKVEANKALANNPATFTHKEFPEQGMKWVQIKRPEQIPEGWEERISDFGKKTYNKVGSPGDVWLADPRELALTDALKHEGDTMRHSVGGYGLKGGYGAGGIDAILDGRASIFSLRDAEGKSYATIEVRKGKQLNDPTRALGQSAANNIDPKLLQEYTEAFARSGKHNMHFANDFWQWLKQTQPETYEAITKVGNPGIEQIKGVGNARIEKKYWPLVQDFVNSGTWSDVNDLENAGLSKLNELGDITKRIANKIFPERKYFSNNDLDKIQQEHIKLLGTKGYAQGGPVRGYAEGGSVHGYAEGGSPIPTNPNQQALWDKYRIQTQSDKQDLLDRLDAATPLERYGYEQLGMEPGLDRATFMPWAGSKEEGNRQFALPEAMYRGLLGAETSGAAMRGVRISPEEAVNAAMGMTTGSFGASQFVGPAAEAGKTMLGMAVKSKGGNWDIKSIENFIDRITPRPPYTLQQAERQGFHPRANQHIPNRGFVDENAPEVVVDTAARNWLNTKLNKYIRNEMGTPEDPVRLAHEEGYSHLSNDFEDWGMPPGNNIELIRQRAGYPEEGFSRYNYINAGYPQAMEEGALKGEMWETLSDRAIVNGTKLAGEHQQMRAKNRIHWPNEFINKPDPNLWINELDPKTPIYSMSNSDFFDQLGFQHIDDELRNMLNPNSGLPADLLITPEQLKKVTMRNMVERVSKIKNWRTAEAERAELDGMMNNQSSTARFEDPTASLSFVEQPGMKWIDIPETTNEKGMKLCTTIGKQGGWCTQGAGLAKDYGSGNNRLVAMLDAEGRPHVQATLATPSTDSLNQFYSSLDQLTRNEIRAVAMSRGPGELNWMPNGRFLGGQGSDAANELMQQATLERFPEWNRALPNITELKPVENSLSSNRANEYKRRDPEYKEKIGESVLNFLNAGEWGRVADLGHYNIVDIQDVNSLLFGLKRSFGLGQEHLFSQEKYADQFNKAVLMNPNAPRFMSPEQLRQFIKTADKEPGLAQGGSVRGYAQGGSVYDSNRVDAILSGITTPVQNLAKGGSVHEYAEGGLVHGYAEGGSPTPTEPSFLGALKDPQFRSEVGNNFMTATNRGAVSMTLGAPVDIVNMALNLGLAGYGYLGNELGLLSPEELPELNTEPFGGSEWIGNKMQEAGIIGGNRNLPAEMIAGTVFPFAPAALEARIPQMTKTLEQLAANYNAPRDLNTGQYMGQLGGVRPLGNLNLTPMVRIDALKGSETQPIQSMLNRARNVQGMTQDSFDELAKLYQDLEPNTSITKSEFGQRLSEFEQSLPASQYNKVDLIDSAPDNLRHLRTYGEQRAWDDSDQVYGEMLRSLGVRVNEDNIQMLSDYHEDYLEFKDLSRGLKKSLRLEGYSDDSGFPEDLYRVHFNDIAESYYQENLHWELLKNPNYLASKNDYAYRNDQRLMQFLDESKDTYFELGVTHPDQLGEYNHYPDHKSTVESGDLIGHIRGTFIPTEASIHARSIKGIEGEISQYTQLAKPNSMVIEEIQSDAQGRMGENKTGALYQAHGTLFKAAVQHALEKGADTVYLPTAKVIGDVRGKRASAYASIYDKEVVKEGLRPLLKIPGVSSTLVGDYREINFTPEAIDFILKGEGQATPGFAKGGSVHEYAEGGSMCGYEQGGPVHEYAEGGSMCGYNHGGLVYDSNRVDAILSQFK